MRVVGGLALLLAGPLLAQSPTITPAAPAVPAAERPAADTPKTTSLGNTFIAPSGWTMSVRGSATILETPEGNSWLALVDVAAKDADAALAAG